MESLQQILPIDTQASKGTPNAEGSLSRLAELMGQLETDQPQCEDPSRDFQPSDTQIKAEIEQIRAKKLLPLLSEWADRYGQFGSRNPFLWTWCQQGVEITTLTCVDANLFERMCETKVLGVMYDVLLDDVADRGGDLNLLEQLIGLASSKPLILEQLAHSVGPYAQFTETVWKAIEHRLQDLPRYTEFAGLLRFDYAQLLNAMRYSHMLNRFPSMMNLAEHDLYLPHNMHMMVSATMDLMASPNFDTAELGRLREAVWHAQYMGRIGNLVTTWQREIGENDFSSGVFARAVTQGDLSPDELYPANRERIEQKIFAGGHEEYFLRCWQSHRHYLLELQNSMRTVDLRPMVVGLQRLICLHLGSRGLK